ncbi:MAG: hypothetical protein CL908_15695 [Deltaproteobacteria bacterium]|nr:hypothetical protein [Deltaproteobacteria bacterium]
MFSRRLGRPSAGQTCTRVLTHMPCVLAAAGLLCSVDTATAGPFADAGHPVGDMAAWATSVHEIVRGPMDIAQPGLGDTSFGSGTNVLGAATADPNDTLSLGDGGSVTLYFESGLSNGPADDFAIFENGFYDLNGLFAELAYVEVASNGSDFARFDADALNPFAVDSFDSLDPTDYHGLAGRHPAGLGTGFDLADLSQDPLVLTGVVDLTNVRFVRVIDVIGDGSTLDGGGNAIYDPYATTFAGGGFDLEAIGVIHVPEPAIWLGLAVGAFALTVSHRSRSLRSPTCGLSRPAITIAALLAFCAIASPVAALTATFDDLGLGPNSILNGSTLAGGYETGSLFFQNDYNATYDSFTGFAASTTTDNTTPGYGNQFSNITGSGAAGSAGFGVAYLTGSIVFPSEHAVRGAEFTNTTYAALSMRDGDAFAKQFGGATGDDPDFFRVLIEGFDDLGNSTGVVPLLLADYRFADNSLDYLVEDWIFQDLTSLGAVRELRFSFDSSDVGSFGINTPQYFAIDNLVTIPEPNAVLLLGLGLAGLTYRQRNAR